MATHHPIPIHPQSLKNVHAEEYWYKHRRTNWVREGVRGGGGMIQDAKYKCNSLL